MQTSNSANSKIVSELTAIGCVHLLEMDGIRLSTQAARCLQRFVDLVCEWNAFASLVSRKDVPRLAESHVVDSLSIAAILARVCGSTGTLLDIGTGGGFPAIPIKIVLPGLEMVLVERAEKKVGFLRKAVGALGLRGVRICHGQFPQACRGQSPGAITARAVEKPDKLFKDILEFLPEDTVYLCQSGDPSGRVPHRFHVEHISDAWTNAGLRRADLHLVTKRPCRPLE